MEYITLGADGPSVSTVALGTWTFAGDRIWGESNRSECVRVVHAALDAGVNLFDTAPNYGNGRSEEILGVALRGRKDALVASKTKVDGKSPAELRAAIEQSLRRLRREAIDLMQVHWPAPTSEETEDALRVFFDLKQEGLVREVGVCNFGVYDLAETAEFPIVSNQVPYSLLWRIVEEGIAGASKDRGLVTIAYSVLQQGLLTGRYEGLRAFPEGRKRTRHFGPTSSEIRHSEAGMEAETEAALRELHRVSTESGRSMLELALSFAYSRSFIDVVLLGARTQQQLDRSLGAARSEVDDALAARLEQATSELKAAAGGNPDMYVSDSRVRFPGPDGTPARRTES